MSDRSNKNETASDLRECAIQDFRAAQSFVNVDPKHIKDHIFCGHLQGCVEKLIKSVLRASKIRYPRVHDIRRLFRVLSDNELPVPEEFAALTSLTTYASEARYGATMEDRPVDRAWLLNLVLEFSNWLDPGIDLF